MIDDDNKMMTYRIYTSLTDKHPTTEQELVTRDDDGHTWWRRLWWGIDGISNAADRRPSLV